MSIITVQFLTSTSLYVVNYARLTLTVNRNSYVVALTWNDLGRLFSTSTAHLDCECYRITTYMPHNYAVPPTPLARKGGRAGTEKFSH